MRPASFAAGPGAASTARSATGAPPPSGRCVTVPMAKASAMVEAAPNIGTSRADPVKRSRAPARRTARDAVGTRTQGAEWKGAPACTVLLQLLAGELAYRLQQPVACRAVRLLLGYRPDGGPVVVHVETDPLVPAPGEELAHACRLSNRAVTAEGAR